MKSAFQDKILDSQNSIDSIGSIDCVDSIDSIESEDSTDSIDSIDFIDSKHRQHSHHTQRENDTTNGAKAPPPSVLSRVPFVCGVNVGGVLNL